MAGYKINLPFKTEFIKKYYRNLQKSAIIEQKKGKVQELSQNVVRKITMLCGNSFVLGLDKTNTKDRRKTV